MKMVELHCENEISHHFLHHAELWIYIYSGFHYAVRAEVINSSSPEDSATCSVQGIGVFILVSMSQLM